MRSPCGVAGRIPSQHIRNAGDRTNQGAINGALRSMTSFLGYSEPEEETYEDSYEAADAGYAVQEHEQGLR